MQTNTLSKEEKVLLDKFSEITKMEIKDMGNLDLEQAGNVANTIKELIYSDDFHIDAKEEIVEDSKEQTKWVCQLCGYIHFGDNPPEKCPLCGASKEMFVKE